MGVPSTDIQAWAEDWAKDMDWCMMAEKPVHTGRGCSKKWKVWNPWRRNRGIDKSS